MIDTAGDGILAEFASAVNAVKAALAVQRTMAERNAAVDTARRMKFRMGVNFGDVVFDDARVYGDGVNIACQASMSTLLTFTCFNEPCVAAISSAFGGTWDAASGGTPRLD